MPILPIVDLMIVTAWTSLLGACVLKVIRITTSYDPALFGNPNLLRPTRPTYDQATGRLSNRRQFVDCASLGGGPDGATVDAEGFVWSAQFGIHRVARFAPDEAGLRQAAEEGFRSVVNFRTSEEKQEVTPGEEITLEPVLVTGSIEPYIFVNRDGEAEERVEDPWFSFYTTDGLFDIPYSLSAFPETAFHVPDEPEDETIRIWVVVRDRRDLTAGDVFVIETPGGGGFGAA